MGRITIKGGTWKNTEDEILKAAVMKYGKNQWSRISSLLIRKSAKQCKSRWYEWLDPSIKKTEWSREEEEKLLHLAKIMPCQWRSIAPMMGRTASQCLEHYEQLLDAAQQPEILAAAAASSTSSSTATAAAAMKLNRDDPRRLRPGEIDPLPEAKPARPDPVDMDEDEKEMLSEARARLANTKGKKAKRKAREKQLEEARRLAVLQKQRELRAAGIEIKQYKKRKVGIDYMAEIPLEKLAPAGFYSVNEEDAETAAKKVERGFVPIDLQELEGKSRMHTEAEERKKDAKRLKLFKETNLPDALLKINQLNDPQQISRRLDMALPTPMVSERELNEIAKVTGGNLVAAIAGGATPMRGGPSATPRVASGLTARTPLRPDAILRESQNLLTLTNQPSSLLGGENAPLNESDFSGAKARSHTVATPNVLATPSHPGATPARGPAVGGTPLIIPGTPMRDGLGINDSSTSLSANQAIAASRSRQDGRRASSKLASSLSALPTPQNQFALVLPDLPKPAPSSTSAIEEDAEDVLARAHSQATQQKEAAWRAETQAIQRGLPRPQVINLTPLNSQDPVEMEIEQEMLALLKYDAAKHPTDPAAKKSKRSKLPPLPVYSEFELETARGIVESELASQGLKLSPAEMKIFLSHLNLSSWNDLITDSIFVPATKSYGLVSDLTQHNPSALLPAYQQQFELTKSQVQSQSKKASKLEQNLGVALGGYQAINTKLKTEVAQLYAQLTDNLKHQNCFTLLAQMEGQSIPSRKQQLLELFQQQQEKERQLQLKYQSLSQQVAQVNGK